MPFIWIKECFVYIIAEKIFDISWAMLGNGWKCIFNRVSWFISIILNFNALRDAYTVQRQNYALCCSQFRFTKN